MEKVNFDFWASIIQILLIPCLFFMERCYDDRNMKKNQLILLHSNFLKLNGEIIYNLGDNCDLNNKDLDSSLSEFHSFYLGLSFLITDKKTKELILKTENSIHNIQNYKDKSECEVLKNTLINLNQQITKEFF